MFAYYGITMVLTKKISLKPFKIKGFRLLIMVRMKGLEPPRRWHWFLRPARIPIPPHPRLRLLL